MRFLTFGVVLILFAFIALYRTQKPAPYRGSEVTIQVPDSSSIDPITPNKDSAIVIDAEPIELPIFKPALPVPAPASPNVIRYWITDYYLGEDGQTCSRQLLVEKTLPSPAKPVCPVIPNVRGELSVPLPANDIRIIQVK